MQHAQIKRHSTAVCRRHQMTLTPAPDTAAPHARLSGCLLCSLVFFPAGGTAFVTTQAISWSIFAATVVMLVVLLQQLVAGVAHCFQGLALGAGTCMVMAQAVSRDVLGRACSCVRHWNVHGHGAGGEWDVLGRACSWRGHRDLHGHGAGGEWRRLALEPFCACLGAPA